MTLITVFVPLLAWATVAWGVGFLPLLGLANATSILLEGLNPLGESVAVLAVCFGVIPTIFLLRYQLETHYERSRLSVVFLALAEKKKNNTVTDTEQVEETTKVAEEQVEVRLTDIQNHNQKHHHQHHLKLHHQHHLRLHHQQNHLLNLLLNLKQHHQLKL